MKFEWLDNELGGKENSTVNPCWRLLFNKIICGACKSRLLTFRTNSFIHTGTYYYMQ
jgi:hypothetical protein